LVFGFTGCSIDFLAEIVLKSIVKCLLFLFLPPLEDLFSPPVAHLRQGPVSDSFVIAPLFAKLDELGRYAFDGYLVLSSTSKSYVQVFRSGSIEAAVVSLLNIEVSGYEKQLPSIAFELEVVEAMDRDLDVQNRMTIPLPIFAAITLLRVSNF
jgi:hypothetical protein